MKTRTKILAVVVVLAAVCVVGIIIDDLSAPKYSYYSVNSVPSGATVWVYSNGCGTSSGDWITPCTVNAHVGTNAVIEVEKSGYHIMERNVYASHEGYVSTETFVLQTDNPVDNLGRWIFG
ncbi:MAG: PEGA domain-containing protein [Deltaproteobacteria bacterium]|nr:PEGA domain-containing protein [Deltaproteobacteria bacterium]